MSLTPKYSTQCHHSWRQSAFCLRPFITVKESHIKGASLNNILVYVVYYHVKYPALVLLSTKFFLFFSLLSLFLRMTERWLCVFVFLHVWTVAYKGKNIFLKQIPAFKL